MNVIDGNTCKRIINPGRIKHWDTVAHRPCSGSAATTGLLCLLAESREWRSKRQGSITGGVWSTVGGQQASSRSTICSLCKEEEEELCRRDLRGFQTYFIESGSLLLGTRMRSSESQPDHDKVGLWSSSGA